MSIPLQFASLYDGQEVFVKKKKKRWEDNIRKRTGLEFANPRGQWRTEKKKEETGCEIICGAPTTRAVKG